MLNHNLVNQSPVRMMVKTRWTRTRPEPSSANLKLNFASRISGSMTAIESGASRDSSCPCYSMVKSIHVHQTLACGYYLDEKRIAQLNQFLDERKVPKIDERVLVQVLTHLKELELMNEQENESDEYRKNR